MNFVRGALVSVAVLITTTALPALAFRLASPAGTPATRPAVTAAQPTCDGGDEGEPTLLAPEQVAVVVGG
jgi:hypothetical protein